MSFLERLKLSSHISGKEKSSPEVSTRRRYIAEKLQPYVLMGGMVLAAPALNGCGENDENFDYENVGSVAQNQWSGNNNPTWGQNSINLSPAIYPASGMNRTAFFSSNQNGMQKDIYCSQTFDGGQTWSAEQPVTVSSGAQVNDAIYDEHGVAICAGNSNCPTPKLIFSTDRSGNSTDVYWSDINIANCGASNVAPVGGDINQAFVGNSYLSVDNSTGKLYYIRTQTPYTADVGTWLKSQIPGITTTLHGGISVHGSHLYVASSDCPNGEGSQDICRYDFDGTTASNAVNLNDIVNSDAINDAQGQTTPFLDDAGDLWLSDNGKIVRKLAVGQGGSGGAGGSGGSGGSTGGSGGMAGAGGMGGSTGGAGGSTGGSGGMAGAGGMGGAPSGGAGGAGAGGMETGGSGGTGGSVDECPIAVETKAGECEVQNCENLAVGDAALLVSKGENADCVFSYPQTNPTDIIYQMKQGTSTLQGRDVYQKTTNYLVRLEHPDDKNYSIDAIQLPLGNGSNLILGAMGTIEDLETFLKDGKLFVRVGVIEKQAFLQIKNSEGQAIDVVIESKGTNIIDAGESFEFAVDDLVALSETIGQKPEGPVDRPPAEPGCSTCAVGPNDVGNDINFQLMAILGFIGLARRRRREGQA